MCHFSFWTVGQSKQVKGKLWALEDCDGHLSPILAFFFIDKETNDKLQPTLAGMGMQQQLTAV